MSRHCGRGRPVLSDPDRYEVLPVAITTDGRWLLADAARAAIEAGPAALPLAFLPGTQQYD